MNWIKRLFGLALGTRPPLTRGELTVPGLVASVLIRRDAHGVVYIEADNDEDVWFGLGFCHGQDRAGQLEILVRVVRGTLAEVAGPDVLGLDRLSRHIGARRAAEAQVAVAPTEIREQLAAYARGINAGLTRGARRKAHEMALLGCQPTMWEAVDGQAVITFLCFALASNWDIELVRLKVLEEDGPGALAALDPAYPDHLPVSSPPGSPAGPSLDRLTEDVAAMAHVFRLAGASNAWAIAPQRTATGRPIMANDPHLNPTAPPQWYLARLQTPEWAAAGATFVGIPAIASGHNGHGAWGLTAGHADNTDLFIERLGPDGRSVYQGDEVVPCPVRREVIHVKGQKPVVEEVLITPRGPIVSPAFAGQRRALSMSATWLEPKPYVGFLGLHKARSVADFRQVFAANSASAVGIVWADTDGHVAFQLACSLPRRRTGNGTIPLTGWTDGVGWEPDGVPHEQTPFCVDPEEGFVCTANNQPAADNGGPFLGVDWLDGYRQAAIAESLAERDDWDLEDTWRLQSDVRSVPWREMRAIVLALEPSSDAGRQALELLAGWDGQVAATSRAASVFELFVAEMCQRLVRAKAPRTASWALGKGFTDLLPYNLLITRRLSHLVRLIEDQPEGYFKGGWTVELTRALQAAAERLRGRYGASANWAWGDVRPLHLLHPFGDKKPLARLFNLGPYPGCGDSGTIAQGAVDLRDPAANPVGVPTLRTVVDVGNWDASRFLLLGGQSGNPFSAHYADMAALWFEGRSVPIAWSAGAIERRARRQLSLRPLAVQTASAGVDKR